MPDDRLAARCHDLVKTYRTPTSSVQALRGITAGFPEAKLTAVAGPSGSGKSSLLRLLSGSDIPTSGELVVGGVQLHRARSGAVRRLRRSIGYVFQRASDNFFPYMTVAEHLRAAIARSTTMPKVDPEEIPALLGISHRLEHLPAELSGGEQARAALAQAVASGASMVIADEPTAELDTRSAELVLETVRALVDRGVTIVMATHDRAVILRSDHLIELDHGLLRKRSRASDPLIRPERPPFGPLEVPNHSERREIARASSVAKTYRRGDELVHAVRGTSLSLREAEMVGLIGRSGSGKTTLLNLLAGWECPDKGAIDVAGRDPSTTPLPWNDVALIPQRLGLIDELTIRENIEYPARLSGSLKERSSFVDELLEALGLTGLEDRFPNEISVGEQQRAACARALVLSPRLLLADEPAGHQDPGWARSVFDALRRGVEDGTCCLAATHDENAIAYIDRLLTMSDGTITEMSA